MTWISIEVHRYIYKERERQRHRDFKELAPVIMGLAKFKICRIGQQAGN